MRSGPLLLASLVFAFNALCDARFLRTLLAERPGAARPESTASRGRPAAEPMPWSYPEGPVAVAPVRPESFQVRRPRTGDTVAVRCGEDLVDVEVKQDLLGNGRLVRPEELTLGGCPATLADDSSRVLTFRSKLHGCSSRLLMTKGRLIYAFTLVYKPASRRAVPRGPGIVRSAAAEVSVECHYPR